MRWNRFFEDLEHDLDSQEAAEKLAIDGESERVRVSRLELRTRMCAVMGTEIATEIMTENAAESVLLRGAVTAVGADWVALVPPGGHAHSARGAVVVPLRSLRALHLDRAAMVVSRGANTPAEISAPAAGLLERMTFAYVLRGFARRRLALSLHHSGERHLHGTIDRVGADHLELALHERGSARRETEVSGFRLVPLHAVAWVGLDRSEALEL